MLWIAAFASIGCGVAWGLYPLPGAGERLHAVPLESGRFVGEDVDLTEAELAVLGRVDVTHRLYTIDSERDVYVTLIDGSRDRHAVHDPRYCFQGAGWKILEDRPLNVPGGQAAWVRAENDGEEAIAVFWFSDGEKRHASLPRYLWSSIVRRVTMGRLGGKPVLVVMQSFGDDQFSEADVVEAIAALRL
jgi:hypothetical protein